LARSAGCLLDFCGPGTVLDQICRHERVLRSARSSDRAAGRQDHRADARPAHHRRQGYGPQGPGRPEGRGPDAGNGNEREVARNVGPLTVADPPELAGMSASPDPNPSASHWKIKLADASQPTSPFMSRVPADQNMSMLGLASLFALLYFVQGIVEPT